MKEHDRYYSSAGVTGKGDFCWIQISKQPTLLQHVELSFTSFHRDWAEVSIASSQDCWFLMGQAPRSWSSLAQALYAPGLHSPSTCYGTL